MTPADAISSLDRQIAEHGQVVTFRRVVPNKPPIEARVRAFVRGYKPDELSSGIKQGSSLMILSPTNMPAAFRGVANRLASNEKVKVSGRSLNVEIVEPVEIGGVLVRLNVMLSG